MQNILIQIIAILILINANPQIPLAQRTAILNQVSHIIQTVNELNMTTTTPETVKEPIENFGSQPEAPTTPIKEKYKGGPTNA